MKRALDTTDQLPGSEAVKKSTMSGSKVNICCLFDGTWVKQGQKWDYSNESSFAVRSLPKEITYSELLDAMYNQFSIDKWLFDLKLEAAYVWAGRAMPPLCINSNDSVIAFMIENSQTVEQRISLCVTPIQKNVIVDPSPGSSTSKVAIAVSPAIVKETHQADPWSEHEDYGNAEADESDVSPLSPPLLSRTPLQISNSAVQTPKSALQTSKSVLQTSKYVGKWKDPCFTAEDIAYPNTAYTSSLIGSCGEIFLGQTFEDKVDLKTKAHVFAMKNNFEFMVKQSSKGMWYIKCKDANCRWRLRGKKLVRSDMFEITAYVSEHTCSTDLSQKDHRQAAPWVVARLIKNNLPPDGNNYMVKNVQEDIKKQYGIDMSYERAWRSMKKAICSVRGSHEESYSLLPSYLYMLQQKNSGTLTDLLVEDGHFRYCFFSLGASRHGFTSCRPVICLDGTFFKTKFGGHMLCAAGFDANRHLYPIAFAIVDCDNHDSWTYFMRKLKEAIGDIENLAFVSDSSASITHALELVFPDAYHGACYNHINTNIVAKFKTDHCREEIRLATYVFRKSVFESHFQKIRRKDPLIAEYLEEIGFDKWARAHFPRNRYNIMTSNYTENFDNKSKNIMTFPICSVVEFIRFMLQEWFSQRREDAAKETLKLAPEMEKDLQGIAENAERLIPYELSEHEYHVLDGDQNCEVNLLAKECTCGMFQVLGIPCAHAVAAAMKCNIDIYSLCDPFYRVETWRTSYEDAVYPCGDESYWNVPDEIKNMEVKSPVDKDMVSPPTKSKRGRPKIKRPPSQDEHVVGRKCTKCGSPGHNKVTCRNILS